MKAAQNAAVRKNLCTEENKTKAVQLDHTMSDMNLRALARTLNIVEGRVAEDRFPLCHKALQKIWAVIGALPEAVEHSGWRSGAENLAGLLVNLRANLVPGLSVTTGNAGFSFDQALEHAGGGTIEATTTSDTLLELDNAARAGISRQPDPGPQAEGGAERSSRRSARRPPHDGPQRPRAGRQSGRADAHLRHVRGQPDARHQGEDAGR